MCSYGGENEFTLCGAGFSGQSAEDRLPEASPALPLGWPQLSFRSIYCSIGAPVLHYVSRPSRPRLRRTFCCKFLRSFRLPPVLTYPL